MKNRIIKTTITFALSLCCIFSFLTISKAHEVYASYYRYVNANSLIVRKTASSKGKVMGSYKKGTKLKCYSKREIGQELSNENSKVLCSNKDIWQQRSQQWQQLLQLPVQRQVHIPAM